MTYRKTVLSTSIVAALMFTGAAYAHDNQPAAAPGAQASAQQTTTSQQASTQTTNKQKQKADERKATTLDTVTVTGIRNAAALSLELQKAAVSKVQVVTAEDIGKLPAKNVADTLQALPGVTVGTAAAGEGGFDVNERISLHGTAPGLTHTSINGHPLMTGNWFVLNQIQTSGRSANYALLPASIVSAVVVHQSSEARLNVGGAAGTVNVKTRRPLQFGKQITVHASVGGVYSELPGKTEPQLSALFNYKNDAGTFGFLVQGFYQKRSLERYGQEVLGYNQIAADSAIATAHPDLAGVWMPALLDSALFTQKRKRVGGVVNLEFKPSDNITLDLEGFYSKMKADNLNRSLSLWGVQARNTATGISNYTVEHNLLTSGTLTSPTQALFGVYDQIGRPGAEATSNYISGDLKWDVSNRFTVHAQVGVTKGEGKSPTQNVLETNVMTTKAGYTMRGLGKPADWFLGDNQFANATNGTHTTTFGWIFGGQGIDVKGKTEWVNLDGTLDFYDAGPLESLNFGLRYKKNRKGNALAIGQGPLGGTDYATVWKTYPTSQFPGNFNNKLGMTAPANIWYLTQDQLAQYNDGRVTRKVVTPLYNPNPGNGSRFNPGLVYWLHEKDTGAYIQANFSGDRWAANVGLHWVHTSQKQQYTSNKAVESTTKGPYYSAFFPPGYYLNYHNSSYSKVLPSANLKFHLSENVIARASVSQTLTRPAYTALSGAFTLADSDLTATGGNPFLKPLISTNFGASLAWYFAPRGLVSVNAFSMNLHDYVDFAVHQQTFKNMSLSGGGGPPVYSVYQVSTPNNIDAHVQGVQVTWDQPIGHYFGTKVNYTWSQGSADGDRPVKGLSTGVYNIGAYFENARFHARVSYNYRSKFYMGVDRGADFYMDDTAYLSAEVGYDVTKWLSLDLTARNLNNPTLKYYAKSKDYGKAPRAYYVNGRQFYLTANFKF